MTSKEKSCFKQLPLRTLVFIFFVLSFLVLTNIFVSSPSKSSFIVDVSMRIKTDVAKAFGNLMNFERIKAIKGAINGTVILKPVNGKDNMSNGEFKLIVDNKIEIKGLNTTINETNKDDSITLELSDSSDGSSTDSNTEVKAVRVQYDILGNRVINDTKEPKRQDECSNCFTHDFKYVIDNQEICKLNSDQTEVELLILILTVHANSLQRQTLRETWLTFSKNNTANVRYAFLLGEVKDSKLQEDVLKESQRFGDIIKEDFVDSYSNLTYKTIMGFKWASTKCGVAKAVMKTDDDMYVNVPNVLNIVRNNSDVLQTNVVGSCAQKAGPIRNTQSKWFASIKSFPGKFYPGFCSGTGYMTSMHVVQKVYEISPHVPFFHLEDVYVALCIKRLGYHLKGFPGFNPGHPKLDPCLYNGKQLVTSHYMSPVMIKRMWNSKCVSKPVKSR